MAPVNDEWAGAQNKRGAGAKPPDCGGLGWQRAAMPQGNRLAGAEGRSAAWPRFSPFPLSLRQKRRRVANPRALGQAADPQPADGRCWHAVEPAARFVAATSFFPATDDDTRYPLPAALAGTRLILWRRRWAVSAGRWALDAGAGQPPEQDKQGKIAWKAPGGWSTQRGPGMV